MNPTRSLLALFLASMKSPDDKATLMAEHGSPEHLTRHAIGRDDEGKIGFVFDTKNGPIHDDNAELLDVVVIDATAMLVTMQNNAKNLGEISTDEMSDIGMGVYGFYQDAGDVKFSALADPELDGKLDVILFDKKADGDGFIAKDLSGKLAGYTIDGGKALVYADQQLILLDTDQLLKNLRDDSAVIEDGASKVEVVGDDVKMARACEIDIGGEPKKVWAYVQKDGNQTNIYFLDKATLELVATMAFEGDYATPSYDGKQLVMVGRTIEGDDETYTVSRRQLASLVAEEAVTNNPA